MFLLFLNVGMNELDVSVELLLELVVELTGINTVHGVNYRSVLSNPFLDSAI